MTNWKIQGRPDFAGKFLLIELLISQIVGKMAYDVGKI
jgi:hypothetical protein